MNISELSEYELSQLLASCEGFVSNDYLKGYAHLILSCRLPKAIKFQTNRHHILPRSYFKYYKDSAQHIFPTILDDIDTCNTVHLYFKDHVLAHYLLCLCTTDKLKMSNMVAFVQMYRRIDQDFQMSSGLPSLSSIQMNADLLQKIYMENRIADSFRNAGVNNGNYGHKWSQELRNQVSSQRKKYYLEHPESIEQKRKRRLGKSSGTKGKVRCYSSDGTCFYALECPPDCTTEMPEALRQLHSERSKGNKSTSGRKWYCNPCTGEHLLLLDSDNIPEGFILGRILQKPKIQIRKKTVHNIVTGEIRRVPEDQLNTLSEDWRLGTGRHVDHAGKNNPRYGKPVSQSTRDKISAAARGRPGSTTGRSWYNNDIIQKLCMECPEGFVKGQLESTKIKRRGERKQK